ncbi:MAG: hypothetical protein M3121_08435 [Chloroflexota bacterium]|nr:hypothetical protein [Chloroflexota bacterium]
MKRGRWSLFGPLFRSVFGCDGRVRRDHVVLLGAGLGLEGRRLTIPRRDGVSLAMALPRPQDRLACPSTRHDVGALLLVGVGHMIDIG